MSRAVVIGMDGTPYSFLEKEMAAGNLPNIATLAARGTLAPMRSEIPTISSIAWASFMTGVNPGQHGIFGFTDRKPGTYELYFPNYSHLHAEPFWDILGRQGKRTCVLNVPTTYPARPLNGILVSGFVAPNLERATYPAEAFQYLESIGYRVDADAGKAHESLDLLLDDLHDVQEKRREALWHFWRQEEWDFFMCTFTGTDRLHHFLWRQYEEGDPKYAVEFLRFYRRLDEIVGEFVDGLPADIPIFMLSDHGFCSLRRQVYINYLLRSEGLLSLKNPDGWSISDIEPSRTQAYCMDPGRVYVNLAGREPEGIIQPGDEYEALLARLEGMLTALTDPDTGEPMVDHVVRGKDIYTGPQLDKAPDLVAVPRRGFDFKGAIAKDCLTDSGIFTGMHTEDDAMLYSSLGLAEKGEGKDWHIRDVAGLILDAMGR